MDSNKRENGLIYETDLGKNVTCIKCGKRLCDCKERHDGTWENYLPSRTKDKVKEVNYGITK